MLGSERWGRAEGGTRRAPETVNVEDLGWTRLTRLSRVAVKPLFCSYFPSVLHNETHSAWFDISSAIIIVYLAHLKKAVGLLPLFAGAAFPLPRPLLRDLFAHARKLILIAIVIHPVAGL